MPVIPSDPMRRPAEPSAAWFPGTPAGAAGPPRLVCFSYAGGTPSAFHEWPALLDGAARVVPVLLPGRSFRLRETPYDELAPLAADVATALAGHGLTGDSVFFGHSMGALLAYEVACLLRDRGLPEPRHLYVSGSRAPHLYGDRADHLLPDDELLAVLRDLGGLGPHADASTYVRRRLPALRADLRACERYTWSPRPPLGCPITAVSGGDDPIATPEQVDAWDRCTAGPFIRLRLAGGHFFLGGASRRPLLHDIRTTCTRLRTPIPPRRTAS